MNAQEYWNGRAEWGNLAMSSSAWVTSRVRDLLNSGFDIECAFSTVSAEATIANAELANTVGILASQLLEDSLSTRVNKSHGGVLEVSVGVGVLTLRLVKIARRLGIPYVGVDCSPGMIAKTSACLNEAGIELASDVRIELGSATDLSPLEDDKFALITWGRLGLHLTAGLDSGRSEWDEALGQVKQRLAPQGDFLVYETLIDDNPLCIGRSKKWTRFRTLAEYDQAIFPLRRISVAEVPFCGEVYTVAVWRDEATTHA